MKTMGRVMRILALVAGLAVVVAASPAEARRAGFSAPEPSVFPQPRDPWRSWGVRSELPRHVGPPRHAPNGHIHQAPAAVWVPGHWVWDGFAWVWWPGHWGAR